MGRKKRTIFSQYLISILAVFAIAGVSFLVTDFIDYKVVAFFLLLTVSILAMLFDIFPVLTAAGLSALVWNFFFIPPRFNFSIGTTDDRVLFMMYFIIAAINAVLTYKIRQIEKVARQKEEKEQAIKLYNTLFNSLSHELQTPIATIIGAADILKDNPEKLTDQNKTELIGEIAAASLRLNKQVENLLSMSRLETGQLRLKLDWCDMSELIYSAIHKLSDKSLRHKIEVSISEGFPLFKLDFGIMEQVIYNLLHNAVQYTPADSTITLRASCTTAISGHFDEEDLSEHRDAASHRLVITVSDNGKGFPEAEIEKVFDKFYRLNHSHPGGTGLGLSIVKGFITAHGGVIQLRNIPTGGAAFTIEIPAAVSYINALKHE